MILDPPPPFTHSGSPYPKEKHLTYVRIRLTKHKPVTCQTCQTGVLHCLPCQGETHPLVLHCALTVCVCTAQLLDRQRLRQQSGA